MKCSFLNRVSNIVGVQIIENKYLDAIFEHRAAIFGYAKKQMKKIYTKSRQFQYTGPM